MSRVRMHRWIGAAVLVMTGLACGRMPSEEAGPPFRRPMIRLP
jgi:hypothetical protein